MKSHLYGHVLELLVIESLKGLMAEEEQWARSNAGKWRCAICSLEQSD